MKMDTCLQETDTHEKKGIDSNLSKIYGKNISQVVWARMEKTYP